MRELHAGRQTRLSRALLGALTVVFFFTLIMAATPQVTAQEDQPAPKKDDGGGGGGEEKKAAPNLFTHIIVSAGWFFGPVLFLVSIGLVTLIVLLAMDLRMGVAVPGAFV